jgi:IS30 family transposase
VDDLTLAQIGKLLDEHEATVSRKLERTRTDLRHCVETALREEKKLSEAQLRLCFEYARQQWPFDLTGALTARD